MQRITSNVWAPEGAGEFYASIFPSAQSRVLMHYPTEGLADFQAAFAGAVLHTEVTTLGSRFRLINAGTDIRPTPALSFIVNMDPRFYGGDDAATRADLSRMWGALAQGGQVRMELGPYPFSPMFGWVEDRYGVNWQFLLTTSGDEPQPFLIPCLLFTARPFQAAAAMELYTSVFEGASLGSVARHVEEPEAVMFGQFALAGQCFAAMDSTIEHDFDFGPGVSLEVECDTQAEIDHLWHALTAVPEDERCGWLTDRFGVSWQITPARAAELLARPGAYANMMQMRKIVIDEL